MIYTITLEGDILRLSDQALVPADLRNVDYLAYLEWRTAGNLPSVEPQPRPETGPARRRRTAEKIRLHDPVASLIYERKYNL